MTADLLGTLVGMIDFLDNHVGASTAILTAVLVLVTTFYAFQNWRMVNEMRRSRETGILPKLAVRFHRLGPATVSTEISNVGPGAAIHVEVELTYVALGEGVTSVTQRLRYPLLVSGESFDLFPPGELNGNLNAIPEAFRSIALKGSMTDAAGLSHRVDEEFTDLAEWRELLGQSKQRYVDPDRERKLASAFKDKLNSEMQSTTKDLSKIARATSAIADQFTAKVDDGPKPG